MPRYIDADELKKCSFVIAYKDERNITKYGEFVEVVRCKECVHHKDAPKTTDVWCERLDGLLPKDWFCADGDKERREDEQIR